MLGKIVDNIIIYPPKNYKTEDGELILNFDKNIDLQKENGFMEIIENIPEYNSDTHYLYREDFYIEDDKIIINYKALEKDINEGENNDSYIEDLEQRISILEQQQNIYQLILSEEVNK